jgi:hypothetical protein
MLPTTWWFILSGFQVRRGPASFHSPLVRCLRTAFGRSRISIGHLLLSHWPVYMFIQPRFHIEMKYYQAWLNTSLVLCCTFLNSPYSDY